MLGSEESDGTTSGKRIGYQQNPSNKSFPPYLLLDKLPINCCRISAINSRIMANKGVIMMRVIIASDLFGTMDLFLQQLWWKMGLIP